MATDLERLTVSLEASTRKFEREMARARGVAVKALGDVQRQASSFEGAVSKAFLRAGTALTASMAGFASVSQIKGFVDTWQDAANKIAAAGESLDLVGARQDELARLAVRTRSDIGATVDLYVGLRRSTEALGASQAQVLRITETVNKAFMVGGASSSEAAAGILQLNQALQSGVLQGDELRSLRENAPLLAKAIADEFGVTIAGLKRLGEEGKLTSDRIVAALLKAAGDIDAQFARTSATIAQSLTNLNTALTQYFGNAAAATGAARRIADGIQAIADNVDVAAPALVVLGTALSAFMLGGPIPAGIAAAASAFYLFGDSIQPIAGEIATLGNLAEASFELAVTAGGEAADFITRQFQSLADAIGSALVEGSATGAEGFDLLHTSAKALVNAVIGAFTFAAKAILATWNGLGFALAEGIVGAMNAVVAAIEQALGRVVAAVNAIVTSINGAIGSSLGTLGNVDLGRIENIYAGAGRRAGEAYGDAFAALARDHVGEALAGIAAGADSVFQRIKARANDLALDAAGREIDRVTARGRLAADNGTLNNPIRRLPQEAKGGKGKSPADKFEDDLLRTQDQIAMLERERQSIGLTTEAREKARKALELEQAARREGVPLTDEYRKRIEQLATAYGKAEGALEAAQQAQQDFVELQQFIGQEISSFFSDIVSGGENAEEAMMNLVKRLADAALQAALLGQGPLAGLLGLSGANGQVGGIIGKLFGGFAGGGYTGPGGKYQPAGVVHRGEYVFDKAAVSRIGIGNLEALRRAGMRGFADGGHVEMPRIPAAVQPRARDGGVSVVVNNNSSSQVSVTENAGPDGKQLSIMIEDVVLGSLAKGGRIDQAMRGRFGLNPMRGR